MVELIVSLANNQLLYTENVVALKTGIYQNYPHLTAKQRADLLSTAIHKILDRNMAEFEESLRKTLKNHLLHEAIKNQAFDISGKDVLEVCMALNRSDDAFLLNLTHWINAHQKASFSREDILALTLRLRTPEKSRDPLPSLETAATAEAKLIDITSIDTMPLDSTTLASTPIDTESILDKSIKIAKSIDSKSVYTQLIEVVLSTLSSPEKSRRIILMAIGIPLGLFLGFKVSSFAIDHFFPSTRAESFDLYHQKSMLIPEDLFLQEMENPTLFEQKVHYKEINEDALLDWLEGRDSMLAEAPYFNSIMEAAKEYNINPLLMFAITGQEQGFVPRSHRKAITIANNPFNVYGSWENFNTDISDTSKIAARTIVNLSRDCPDDVDPIKWINRKYAEDPNWHIGVSQILEALETAAGNEIK